MMQLFANNAATTLGLSLLDDTTTVVVDDPSSLPALAEGEFFVLTLIELTNGTETDWEIIKVTARDDATLTVERGHEGTTPRAWTAGTPIELRMTAGSIPPSTTDGRALLGSTLTQQKSLLGIEDDIIFAAVTESGDDLIFGAANA
jgi:hypothetical protein